MTAAMNWIVCTYLAIGMITWLVALPILERQKPIHTTVLGHADLRVLLAVFAFLLSMWVLLWPLGLADMRRRWR